MSYMLSHLENGYQVDQAILSEEDRVVVSIRIHSNLLCHNIAQYYECTLNIFSKKIAQYVTLCVSNSITIKCVTK